MYLIFSQNDEDEWNGFQEVAQKPVEKSNEFSRSTKSAKVKPVEDFSSLDVKSNVKAAPKPKNDDKEADLWDMLNS